MIYQKKMTRSGGVTLPAALRREIGLEDGEKFTILQAPDGSIVLRRAQPKCCITGSEDDLVVHDGKYYSVLAVEALYHKLMEVRK